MIKHPNLTAELYLPYKRATPNHEVSKDGTDGLADHLYHQRPSKVVVL